MVGLSAVASVPCDLRWVLSRWSPASCPGWGAWRGVWWEILHSHMAQQIRNLRLEIYPCEKYKKLFYFSIWNLNWNWNWNWDGSWNDLRECQKLWGGLCILCRTYRLILRPPITTIQNAQAFPELLTLPQVIPTSIPIPIPIKIPQ